MDNIIVEKENTSFFTSSPDQIIRMGSKLEIWKKRFFFKFIPVLLLLLIILIVFIIFYLYVQNNYAVKNIMFSNNTDQGITLSWEGKNKGSYFVVVSEENSYSVLTRLIGAKYWDDRQINYKNGYVTLKNLKSNTRYTFGIFYYGIQVYKGSFKTAKVTTTLSTPHPLVGQLKSRSGKDTWDGSIVYAFLQNNDKQVISSIISTPVRSDGKYILEKGNFRDNQLSQYLTPGPYDAIYLMIQTENETSVQKMNKL